ncbi:MAG: type II secretion system protein GspM [Acetobacteraceae bacterium]
MTRSLVPLMHRLAALGILFLLLLLAWFVLVAPVIGMIEERYAEIETLSDRLASLRATMRRIPELERREAALKAQLEDRGGVWTGPSDALIATAMQDRIREAASLGARRDQEHRLSARHR